jgi:peptide/nickel transport system substrate-binding protein
LATDPNQIDNFFISLKAPKKEKPERKNRFADLLPTKKQLRHLPKVLSKRERYLILVLGVVAICALIAIPISAYYHFTKPAPDYGGSFTEGLVGAPKHINPLLAQASDVDRDLSNLIYSGLMRYGDNGEFEPCLAGSYSVSDDGLNYTFKLRSNLKWHDGQPITADDVIFTILTAQNTDYGSFQMPNWQGVDVSKLDEQTVVFKLKTKYAQFLSNTTLGILPKHIWENVKAANFALSEMNIKPAVGSGPYKFSKIKRDSLGNIKSFELEAFDKYYAGKPYISKIIFKFYASDDELINAYNSNDINSISSISPQKINSIRFLGQLKIKKLKLPRYFAVFFNQNQSKQLSDKNVRMALSYATDKEKILKEILSDNGTIVDSPMLPGIINIPDDAEKYNFDIEKAKKTLDDAGWKLSETDGVREKAAAPAKKGAKPAEPTKLEIRLTTSNWPELTMVADQIKKQWEAAGAKVNVETLDLSELQQVIRDRDYEALLFGEVLGLDPDPLSFWHSSQKRDPGLNLALYDNKDADKLLEDARLTQDKPARLSKYDDFQKTVAKDVPAIFLYSPDYLYAQPAKIKNNNTSIVSIPSDRFATVNQWYINTRRVSR